MSSPATIGYGLCGSFCTLTESISALHDLAEKDYCLYPILSEITYSTDTRFGRCEEFRNRIEEICGRPVLHTIPQVEPIGPKGYLDALIIAPCTGNTLGKLANGIYDRTITTIITPSRPTTGNVGGMPLPTQPRLPMSFAATAYMQI